MKKILLSILLIFVGLSCFAYSPEGKEEFCFAPYFYSGSWWVNDVYTLQWENRYLYGDFYADIDDAINTFSNSYTKSGLWYWDYVLTKGYFDSQIYKNSKGEEINDKYDYFKVVLENGKELVYKSVKGDKYTPAGEGLFVIKPIEQYRPIIEKQSFVPGSWVQIVGCTGEQSDLLKYKLSNGAELSPTIVEEIAKAVDPIKDDSTRLGIAELASLLEYPSCNYDAEQNIVWIQMCDLLVATYIEKYPMLSYVGYRVDNGAILPRIVFISESKDVSALVVKYDDKEWDAFSSLKPTFKDAGMGYVIADCWIGSDIQTLRSILESKEVKVRVKTNDGYKSYDVNAKNLEEMAKILKIYDSYK